LCTESEGSESFKELYEGVLEFAEKDRVYTAITQPAGRASELGLPGAIGTTPDCPPGACPGASIPMIFPDGRVTACIGPAITLKDNHPLLLGNLNEGPLAEILDEADENTVLHVIRVWGPKKLMALLREFDSKIQLPREFLKGSICDACHQMLRNEESRAALQELNRNARLREKMNYARIYYLGEYSPKVTQMNR
jgi:hypothetical protein